MDIVIIGAGIGGLALARALGLRGMQVRVLEQADAIREVGAGLQVSPNGLRVLDALGLGDQLRDRAVTAQAVRLCDYKGKSVAQLELGRKAGAEYLFLHRADLIACLRDGADLPNVEISLGQKVARVEPGQPAVLTMEDGTEHSADLVVGADGLHSVLRKALSGTQEPFFTEQVAWRALVPNIEGRGPEVRVHMGPHRHVVSYPIREGALLNLVAVQERAAWQEESWSQRDDPDNLRAAFADFGPEVQAMLGAVETVHLWGLFRHPILPRWHDQGCVLMGDAAHPTLPFLAQGASMALEDAWVLATALDLPGTLAPKLAAFQTRREARVHKIVDAASANAWKYHLAFPPVRMAAHLGLRMISQLAPGRLSRRFDWLYDHDVTAQRDL